MKAHVIDLNEENAVKLLKDKKQYSKFIEICSHYGVHVSLE